MSRAESLLSNTLVYAIGNFGSKILSYALVPIFSFFVSKEDLGLYDLFLTSIALLFPVVTLQLSEAMYRYLLTLQAESDRVKIISTGLLSSVILLIAFGFVYYITAKYYDFKYQELFYLLLLGVSLFPVMQQIIRGLGNNKLYSAIGILNSILLVVFNIIFLYFLEIGLLGILIASIISYSVSMVAAFYLGGIFKYFSLKKVDFIYLTKLLKYSAPLIPNAISWWLINASNRFLILHSMGLEANGEFAISSRFPAILAIINSIFMLAWQDEAISKVKTDQDVQSVSKIFNQFLVFELCIIILFIPLSKFVVSYGVESSYSETWKYMPLLFLGTAFSAFSAFYGSIYLRDKKTLKLFTTTLIGGILNIVITFALIPFFGLFSAGVGTFIGFLTVFLLRLFDLKSSFNLKVKWLHMFILTSITVILFLLSLKDQLWLHMLIFTIGIALFIVFNRRMISFIIKFFKVKFISHNSN